MPNTLRTYRRNHPPLNPFDAKDWSTSPSQTLRQISPSLRNMSLPHGILGRPQKIEAKPTRGIDSLNVPPSYQRAPSSRHVSNSPSAPISGLLSSSHKDRRATHTNLSYFSFPNSLCRKPNFFFWDVTPKFVCLSIPLDVATIIYRSAGSLCRRSVPVLPPPARH